MKAVHAALLTFGVVTGSALTMVSYEVRAANSVGVVTEISAAGPTRLTNYSPYKLTDYFPHLAYSQAAFPCNEDEALMFHRSFGPDAVGCVNLDEVR